MKKKQKKNKKNHTLQIKITHMVTIFDTPKICNNQKNM